MNIRLYFAKEDCSPDDFTFDGEKGTTLCFFRGRDGKKKEFLLYLYKAVNNDIIIKRIGYVYLFFVKEEDCESTLTGEYYCCQEFFDKKNFYSIGNNIIYYWKLQIIKEDKNILTALRDIIYLKENLESFDEKNEEDKFFGIKLNYFASYLVEVSRLIFKYDSELNYFMITKSNKLYTNKSFANEYKKVYEEYFDKLTYPLEMNTFATNDFLDFLQKYISNGEGVYSDFEGIINKIKEKYKNEITQKKLLMIYEPVRQAYEIIEKIKETLKVKIEFLENTKNCLGHYTSMSTLKILLENQKKYIYSQKFSLEDSLNIENASEESTVNCLRLTNSRLMNDPLEGKVITNFLDSSYNQKDFLPSSIYMMCITPNVDNLPMWQQYGVNGTGAFIRLKNEFLEKIVSDSKADIYRVCYLSLNNEVNVSHMDNEDALLLKEMLGKLKSICEELKKNEDDKYSEILSRIQQDISFLFKTADYSYEAEYRIVLSTSDDFKFKVKCEMNKDYPFPFLYIYLDDVEYDNSKCSEVIIGPKAIDVDFLGPYINYLDPEIDISVSKIPYR